MISNIADRADARILSDDEINAVAGGSAALWGVIGFCVVASAAIVGAMVADRNSAGTRDTGGRAGAASGGGAHESGPDDRM
jgi:hypothetical protein